MSKTKFWNVFNSIKHRCNNPNVLTYSYYGGRGIKCLWKSFEEFRDDMYESYQTHVKKFGRKQTTIERINNNGHYYKENCRWATHKEQGRNTRFNNLLTFNGQTKCLSEWAEESNITVQTLWQRLRLGWSIEKALTTKPIIGRNQFSQN